MTSVTSEIYELLCCKQFVTVAILLIYHVIRFTDFVLNAVPIRVDENHELKNNQKNHFFTPDFFIVMNFLMDCVRDGHLSFVCCILTLLLLGGFPAMMGGFPAVWHDFGGKFKCFLLAQKVDTALCFQR